MGVLKVWDGTDWRKVGCGGSPGTVEDNFNRLASSLGSTSKSGKAWSVSAYSGTAAFGTDGTAAKVATASSSGLDYAVIDAGVNDPPMSVRITAHPSGAAGGLTIRYTNAMTAGFLVVANTRAVAYGEYVGGSWSGATVMAPGGTFQDGDVLGVTVSGTTVTGYINGVPLTTTATTNLPASTKVGLNSQNGDSSGPFRWDDFSIDSVGPIAPPGRLKLWTGTEWVREKCDGEGEGTPFSDDFNRANGAPANGWTPARREFGLSTMTWAIASNEVTCTANAGYAGGVYVAMLLRTGFAPDFDMSFTLDNISGSPTFGRSRFAAWRVDDVNAAGQQMSYYLMDSFGVRWVAANLGAEDLFDDFSRTWPTLANGDRIRVVCNGTQHTIYRNGTEIWTHTDIRNQSADSHGLASLGATWNETHTFDDFEIGPAAIAHPLKLWDGTTWQTVACMVPAVTAEFVDQSIAGGHVYPAPGPITVTVPSGRQAGDLLVFTVAAGPSGFVTPPSGWTEQDSLSGISGLTFYTRISDGTEADVTVTSYEQDWVAEVRVFRNATWGGVLASDMTTYPDSNRVDTFDAPAAAGTGRLYRVWSAFSYFSSSSAPTTIDAALGDTADSQVGNQRLLSGIEAVPGTSLPARTATTGPVVHWVSATVLIGNA